MTSRLSTLEQDTEGHSVWTMKKIQKLKAESKDAVTCVENVMRDGQVGQRDFDAPSDCNSGGDSVLQHESASSSSDGRCWVLMLMSLLDRSERHWSCVSE